MLTINGKPLDTPPSESFPLDLDPVTGQSLPEPEQLELKAAPKKPGTFTKNARALKKRSGPKIRGGANG